ncbi:paraquat-inducible protein [Pseudoalteromonas phenolica]|uniref:paraquat-inducible protein A n=1 Tax=Pseudoalteromonas phenolica TaxID=161398 RepID=UPI00110BCF10|nr:paraquat-inducible protein A [Pseudoalteromonas phenolica]TMN86900.1 paraquat-inducible protein [Pseudoalteromonas phenolica]
MILACKQCDSLVRVSSLGEQQRAICPCCGNQIVSYQANQQQWLIAFSLTTLLFLLSSLYPTFISFSQHGLVQQISLWQAFDLLADKYSLVLSGIFVFSIFLIPLFICLLVLLISSHYWQDLNPHNARYLARLLNKTKTLNLADIFLVAVLVSVFKLMSLADIGFGLGFWAYILFVVCFIETLSLINETELWERQQMFFQPALLHDGKSARAQELRQCLTCAQLTRESHCPRCYTKTYYRKPNSAQRAIAWMITAAVFLIPANILPIMNTINLGNDTPATIFSGVVVMWESGSYPIAILIFIASICIPIAKAIALFYLILESKKCTNPKRASKIYRWLEIMGKWSMIDVFVVIILVSLVQLGTVLSVEPQIGIVFFTIMVLCQIVSVNSFDPRILWDKFHNHD